MPTDDVSERQIRPDEHESLYLPEFFESPDAPQSLLDAKAQAEGLEGAERSVSPFQASLHAFMRDKRAVASLAIVILLILFGFLGPVIYSHIGGTLMAGLTGNTPTPPSVYHDPGHQELTLIDQGPNGYYWLGTDHLGRDVLARLMEGVTVSIAVGFMVVAFDIILGLIVGTFAGYFGGWIDTFLARFTDLMFAFPQLLFAILAAATLGLAFTQALGYNGRLILVSLALGITVWPQMARYVRGQTLQIKEQQYIEASRMSGTTDRGIIMRHIVPNLFSIVLTAATLDIVGAIIGEATLSLLGLGVQAPGSSLGLMISEGADTLNYAPWETMFPTIVLAILVITFAFIGDGLGDAFNPRRKDI